MMSVSKKHAGFNLQSTKLRNARENVLLQDSVHSLVCDPTDHGLQEILPQQITPSIYSLESLSDELLCRIMSMVNWNAATVANLALVSKHFSRAASLCLWREFCLVRAPKMTANIIGNTGSSSSAHISSSSKVIEGGWAAYSKIMRFCPGTSASPLFEVKLIQHHIDHLGKIFSKSGGRKMVDKTCKRDTIYVTETCDHIENGEEVGVFRGIVKKFAASRMRRQLEARRTPFQEVRVCPFCGMAVWSLMQANLIPSGIGECLNCAFDEEKIPDCDVFVCLSGHLHGMCMLGEPDSESEELSDPQSETTES